MAGGPGGHGRVTGQHRELVGPHGLARLVDLEVPEAQEGVGEELLGAVPLDVGEAQIGALGAVGGGDLSVVVEQVADMHVDGAAGQAVAEVDGGPGGHDLAEVHHHRPIAQRPGADRGNGVLGDPGALGVEVGERGGPDRPEHGGCLPAAVVVVHVGPTQGGLPAVDDLHEVVGLVVPGGRRQPLGRTLPPGVVGAEHLAAAVGVHHRELQQRPGNGRRAPVARPVPVVEQPDGVGPAGL